MTHDLKPGNREQQLTDSWERNAAAWANSIEKGQILSRRLATDDAILQAVLQCNPSRVLDAGCGEGWLSRKLAGEGMAVLGIDGSTALIEKAKAAGGASFEVLSYEQLMAEPDKLAGEFDCIVCNFSLFGEIMVPLLKALKSKLSDNGRLIIQTVHPFSAVGEQAYEDGWRVESFAGFEEAFPEPMPWYFRTVGSWVEQLNGAGLKTMAIHEPLHPETGRPLSLIFILE